MRSASLRPSAAPLAAALLGTLVVAADASATTVTYTQPGLDRWMYPFSSTGTNGARGTASVFGSVGSPGFDDRDAQFLAGFDTSVQIPTGAGAANYAITSVRVKVVDSAGTYNYDPTYDAVSTYANPATDADAGRPIELHGVGLRNGFTTLTFNTADANAAAFKENSLFGVAAEGTRNAYPLGYDPAGTPRDVSNNVDGGFESAPWAIGTNAALPAGAPVPVDTAFTFDLNVTDPFVLAYLQEALNDGTLGVMISSLGAADQQNPNGIPQFYNKENAAHNPALGSFVAPQLEVAYSIVPEPTGAALLGLAGVALLRRRRREPQD